MTSEDWSNEADPLGDAIDVSRKGFAIEVQRPAPGVIVLRLEGKLDMWTSLPLMDAIIAAFHEHPELLAVDVRDVPCMDGTGLRVLVEGSDRVEEGQVRFAVICRAGSEVARLLGQTDGHRALYLYESTDDALGSWLDEAGGLPAGV